MEGARVRSFDLALITVSQIADEFKIVVIEAIQSLCVKYPQKHSVLLNFLSVSLREVR